MSERLASAFQLDGRRTVLREMHKLKSEDGPSRLVLTDVGPGIVTIRWDNQHSMFRSKQVNYAVKIDVAVPGEQGGVPTATEGGGGAK